MNHAVDAVAPLNPEMVQVGDTVGQRAQRRGLLEGSVRPVGIVEVFVLAQHDHQVLLVPDQGPAQQLTAAATDPPLHDRVHPRRLNGGADDPGASCLEHGVEGGGEAVDAVTPLNPEEALRAELDRIRQRGWACTVEELETGLNTVAAPVRGADSSVVAGLSASGPSYRLGTESFPELAKKLQAGADEISSQLGYYRSQKPPSDG